MQSSLAVRRTKGRGCDVPRETSCEAGDGMAMCAFAGAGPAVEDVLGAIMLFRFRRLFSGHDVACKLFDALGQKRRVES